MSLKYFVVLLNMAAWCICHAESVDSTYYYPHVRAKFGVSENQAAVLLRAEARRLGLWEKNITEQLLTYHVTIEKDGTISNVELYGRTEAIDSHAVETMRMAFKVLPKFVPALHNDEKVRSVREIEFWLRPIKWYYFSTSVGVKVSEEVKLTNKSFNFLNRELEKHIEEYIKTPRISSDDETDHEVIIRFCYSNKGRPKNIKVSGEHGKEFAEESLVALFLSRQLNDDEIRMLPADFYFNATVKFHADKQDHILDDSDYRYYFQMFAK